jgi:hypothetical protein
MKMKQWVLVLVAGVALGFGLFSAFGADEFSGNSVQLNSQAYHDADVTPSDSTDLANVSRSLYVTNGGVVVYTTVSGETVTRTFPDNYIVPVRVKRVWSTGTTATGICNWY